MPAPRRVLPLGRVFTPRAEAEITRMTAVEGRKLGGEVQLRTLMVSPSMLFVETTFAAGQASKPHVHADHKSIVYVVSGKVKVTIAGEVFWAGPGDAWYNAPGVEHHIEALEATVSVEVKSPPVRAW